MAVLEEDLFRREYSRLLSALTRLFGANRAALLEDVVQDTLVAALHAWQLGLPDQPQAWLLATAKHRAIDLLRRERRIAMVSIDDDSELSLAEDVETAFSADQTDANELGMMLACCHGELAEETQVTLILRFLCGFGPREIASAFLVDTQTIDRRLHRGRAKLAAHGKLHEVHDDDEVLARLPSLIRALYLLFSEGYHGTDPEHPVRAALCADAMRLVDVLLAVETSARPEVHALQALFCFDAARLATRVDHEGVFVPLADQDRSRWDRALIDRGVRHLGASASGQQLTRWHVEAGIAYEHASATSVAATNWGRIVGLYDALVQLAPGPVVAFNRALAIGELAGPRAGLDAIAETPHDARLDKYSFYWAARGELRRRLGDLTAAREDYQRAISLARSRGERLAYQRKLDR